MKFSHSKNEIYLLCPRKYKIQYIEGYRADKTFSSLIFGRALDYGLNHLLESKRDGVEPDMTVAKGLLLKEMATWTGQNAFEFYKGEVPDGLDLENTPKDLIQVKVWTHLLHLGYEMLERYQAEIIPLFKRVIDVQMKKEILNDDGDTLVLIVDFMAEMQDGRIVLLDNKSASKKYTKNSVKQSDQLALYSEFFDNKYCGYVVLLKKPHPATGEMWHMVIDEIPEEQTALAFHKLESSMRAIKEEKFQENNKSCYAFGRLCELHAYCKRGDDTGLIKREKK